MNRHERPSNGGEGLPDIPEELRAADALLSEVLAEWARADPARTERIHRATVAAIGVPATAGRIRPAAAASPWRWAIAIGGGLAAAAMVLVVLRSGGEPVPEPTGAPIEVVEAVPSAPADVKAMEAIPDLRLSAAEPVLVALIERDASRWTADWTGDWTGDDTFDHSEAWASVVPVLETRDAGFDIMAGEVGAILSGGGGLSGSALN
jgi:hypothetical protein